MIKYAFKTVLLLTALTLGGCSTIDDLKDGIVKGYDAVSGTFQKVLNPIIETKKKLPLYDGECPPVSIRPDLANITDFYNPSKWSEGTIISTGTMTNVQNTCRVENNQIIMQIDLSLSGQTGPKARVKPSDKPSFSYPYFIAITNNQGFVVSKEIFAATLVYGATQQESSTIETVFQNMPIPDKNSGEFFNVVVGFQLSDEQLSYNQQKLLNSPANIIADSANNTR